MFTSVMNPLSKFQDAPLFVWASSGQENLPCTSGVWEFPSETELADELQAALSEPFPTESAPEIAPEDFERFCQGFLS